MASTQRIVVDDGTATWTVLDAAYGVVGPVEEFLEYLRTCDYAPNTVKAYARGLALWWTYLERRCLGWTEVQLDPPMRLPV
ncbi:MAG: site-specific integrase [Nocardioidaceae bacterium]|nr:site-specific integrase [Nocardioidaceae bacterium]